MVRYGDRSPIHQRKPTIRFEKALITAALVAVVALGGVVFAWSTDGQGKIRCGSSATVAQQSDGTWTVTAAGKNGSSGGNFPAEGKAAPCARVIFDAARSHVFYDTARIRDAIEVHDGEVQ